MTDPMSGDSFKLILKLVIILIIALLISAVGGQVLIAVFAPGAQASWAATADNLWKGFFMCLAGLLGLLGGKSTR